MESSKFSLVLRLLVVVLVLLGSVVNGRELNEFSTAAYLADGDTTTHVNYISNLFLPSSANAIPCGETCVYLGCFIPKCKCNKKDKIIKLPFSSRLAVSEFPWHFVRTEST
ncbi:hypothetical protein FNV43_RR00475 [Rhamnella rubrinervis]|uniref:Uncharacterized protein n=1 Tax=Rhamnella rubrinervis TaxID=2594499 RepID=A0A8K0HQN9_9ROSA|nr:hypothetical protein FNV43_RR00475 [Rhamnella rubrinervis]